MFVKVIWGHYGENNSNQCEQNSKLLSKKLGYSVKVFRYFLIYFSILHGYLDHSGTKGLVIPEFIYMSHKHIQQYNIYI